MIRKICIALTAAALCVMTLSCAGGYPNTDILSEAAPIVRPEPMSLVGRGKPQEFIDFAYRTAPVLLRDAAASGDNALYSPLTLYRALALAAVGAEGVTKSQLLELLGMQEINCESECLIEIDWYDNERISGTVSDLLDRIYIDDEYSRCLPSLSLWLDDSFADTVKPQFADTAANDHHASVYVSDFGDGSAQKAIARWTAEQTSGMITPEVSGDINQLMSIVSTLDFSDEWIDRFDEALTVPGTFTREDDTALTLDFMNREYDTHHFRYGKNWTSSSLGLKGNSASVIFVLPDEGVTVSELLETNTVEELLTGGEQGNGEVLFRIPKIDFTAKYELSDMLASLRASDMFTDAADFSGITDDPLFLSGISHENRFAMTENGVSAASFTNLMYAGAALPNGRAEIICDRPFLFAVTARYGVVLFVGCYMG